MQQIFRSVILTSLWFFFMGINGALLSQGNDCDQIVQNGMSIQDAIDDATNDEIICVEPGIYEEGLTVNVNSLTVVAADENDKPILDGSNAESHRAIEAEDIFNLVVDGFEVVNFSQGVHAIDVQGISVRNTSFDIPHMGRGVYLSSTTNAAITDNEIINGNEGIRVLNAENSTIEGNTVTGSSNYGIFLHQSEDINIVNNELIDNGSLAPSITYAGIWVQQSENITASENTINDNLQVGIRFDQSPHGTLSNNTVTDNHQRGILILDSDSTTVHNNTMSGHEADIVFRETIDAQITGNNLETGLLLEPLEDSPVEHFQHQITDNTVQGDELYYALGADGSDIPDDAGQVILTNSSNMEISGMEFYNAAIPIQVFYSSNITVNDNEVTSPSSTISNLGLISIFYSSEPAITNNTVYSETNGSGIMVAFSSNATISENNASDISTIGIRLFNATHAMVSNNHVEDNGRYGIVIEGGSDNTVAEGNTVLNNRRSGIAVGQQQLITAISHDVIIRNNTSTGNNSHGIRVHRAETATVENNTASNNEANGIAIVEADSVIAKNNIANNNDFNGISIIGNSPSNIFVNNAQVMNNTVENNGRSGIALSIGTEGVVIENNTSVSNERWGIVIAASDSVQVTSNNSSQNGWSGIHVRYGEVISISNNNVSENNEHGIEVGRESGMNPAVNVLVRDNTVTNNLEYGISIPATADTTTVRHNTITENEEGGIIEGASNSLIYENTVSENVNYGIRIEDSQNSVIGDNEIFENDISGMIVEASANVQILNNTITNHLRHAIILGENLENVQVENTTAEGHGADFLLNNTSGVQLNTNTLETGMVLMGTEPEHFIHEIAADNTAQGKEVFYVTDESQTPAIPADPGQIIIANSDQVVIEGHELDGVAGGIQVAFCESAEITGNTLTNSTWDGIILTSSDHSLAEANHVSYEDEADYYQGSGIVEILGDEVEIVNNTVTNAVTNGILLQESYSTMVTDNELTAVSVDGISITQSEAAIVQANTIFDSVENGIYVHESFDILLNGNTASENQQNGILIADSDEVTASENTLSENEFHGAYITGTSNVALHENHIVQNNDHGVQLEGLEHPVISENTITENAGSGMAGGGFGDLDVFGAFIDGNNSSNNAQHGISFERMDSLSVVNNTFSENSEYGIYLDLGNDMLVENNAVLNNGINGLHARSRDNLTISGNIINSNNSVGVYIDQLRFGSGLILSENEISNNQIGIEVEVTEGGLSARVLDSVQIIENTIQDNTATGILVLSEPEESDDVQIHFNSIYGNNTGIGYEPETGFSGPDHYLNATNNWWGAENGPGGGANDPETGASANGDGDSVTDDVLFDPWLDSEPVFDTAFFAVTIDSTNSPIQETEELNVYISVTNDGEENASREVELLNFDSDVVDSEVLTLDVDETETITLIWDTDEGEYGEGEITVRSRDDSDTANVMIGETTSLTDESSVVTEYRLSQNYPNPFNPSTVIEYALPEAGEVELAVYNILGRRVATLVNEQKQAGHHKVTFDAGNLASGVYIYRIRAGEFTDTRKLTLIK